MKSITHKLKQSFQQGQIQKFLVFIVWIPFFASAIFILAAPKSAFHSDILYRIINYAIPPILTCLVCFTISTIALLKGKREIMTLIFSLSSILHGILHIDISFLILLKSESHAHFISRLDHFFYVFTPALGLHFIYLFINRKERLLIKFLYIMGTLFIPLTLTEYYLYNEPFHFSWGMFHKSNWGFQFFGTISIILAIWGIFLVFKKWNNESIIEKKKQYQYILLGYLSTGVLTLLNIPAMNGIDFYPMGNFSFISFLLLGYGIFQYNVIRINVYIKQRIITMLVKLFLILGFTALTAVSFWALYDYKFDYIINRIIPYGLPPLISVIFCGFLSFLALRLGQNQKDFLLFSILSFVYTCLSIDILLNAIVNNAEVALQLSRWDHIFFVFIPAATLHLIYIIAEQKKRYWIVYFEYAAGAVFMLFTQSDIYFQDMHLYYWGYFGKKAIIFDLVSLLGIFTIIYGSYILLKAYLRTKKTFSKNRLFYFLLGVSCTGLLTATNIPATNGFEIYPMGNFVFIPFVLFAVGMFRQNIAEAIKLLLSILYYSIFFILIIASTFFINTFYTATYLSSFIIAAVMIIISYIILFSIKKAIIVIFQKTKYSLKIKVDEIFREISSKRTIKEINTYLEQIFFQNFQSIHLMILHYDPETSMFMGEMSFNPYNGRSITKHYSENKAIIINSPESIIQLFTEHPHLLTQEKIEEWILNNPHQKAIHKVVREASIVQPIFHKNSVIALMVLGSKTSHTLYSREEKEFIHTIGLSLGAYIENAIIYNNLEKRVEERTHELKRTTEELETERNKLRSKNKTFEQELDLARKIQEELIPKNNPADFISVLYRPMKQVGGDFYDFLKFRQENLIGIFLSDVSGHGVPAAFITSMVKTIILQSGEKKHDPAALLTYINEVLHEQTAGNFITAFYGIYNPTERTLVYANAGHNQPYIIQEDITQIQGGRTPAPAILPFNMSQKSNRTYKNYEEKFQPGSKILFYTDGLTEAKSHNTNEFFEYSSMFDVFLENKNQPSDTFINNLYGKLVDFRQGDIFDDDICLICLDVE